MLEDTATRQLTFRFPEALIERVDDCVRHLHTSGLRLTRADVVRLLVHHALTETDCDLRRLLDAKAPPPVRRKATKRRAR